MKFTRKYLDVQVSLLNDLCSGENHYDIVRQYDQIYLYRSDGCLVAVCRRLGEMVTVVDAIVKVLQLEG